MASAAVARFGGRVVAQSVRTSGVLRAQPALAPAAWAGVSKRCMSTKFAKSHEYIKMDGDIGTVGITEYATKSLGDIVFVDLPEVGDKFDESESFGSVESVKAASDVYSPAAGEVVEINEKLTETPAMLNDDPMGEAWFIKIKVTEGLSEENLLDQKGYDEHLKSQE